MTAEPTLQDTSFSVLPNLTPAHSTVRTTSTPRKSKQCREYPPMSSPTFSWKSVRNCFYRRFTRAGFRIHVHAFHDSGRACRSSYVSGKQVNLIVVSFLISSIKSDIAAARIFSFASILSNRVGEFSKLSTKNTQIYMGRGSIYSERCSRCWRHDASPNFMSWMCNVCTDRHSFTKGNEIKDLEKRICDLEMKSDIAAKKAKQHIAGITLKCTTHTRDLMDFRSRFGSLLESELLFDLTVEIDGRNLRAHKCILASR